MDFDFKGIIGADISFYQGYPPSFPIVDFQIMRDYGFSFVIIRAGQRDYEDAAFRYNWPAARGILPRHAYWYYDNTEAPRKQAQKFWSILEKDPDGMFWLDLEDRLPGGYAGLDHWYNFLEEFKRQSGMGEERLGIYTGYWYWRESTRFDTTAELAYFKRYPLWMASYGKDPVNPVYKDILVPKPWESVLILQTGTPTIGRQVGVYSLEIDYNHFNGDQDKFRSFFREIDAPEVIPGAPMITGTGKLSSTPNTRVRKGLPGGGPDPAGTTIGGILPGQAFKADKKQPDANNTLWLHIIEVGGKAIDGWSAGYLLSWTEVPDGTELPPTPPFVLPDLPVSITLGDDITYAKQTVNVILKPK